MATPGSVWPNRVAASQWDSWRQQNVLDFEQEAGHLFEEDEDFNVTIIESRGNGLTSHSIKNLDHVADYCADLDLYNLDRNQNGTLIDLPRERGITRIIMIPQSDSWQEFNISKQGAQTLFSHLNISNSLWKSWRLLGRWNGNDNETAGGLSDAIRDPSSDSFVLSYSLKHVEEHGYKGRYDPWSLRQMGVHCEHSSDAHDSTFVVLNPSKTLTLKISQLQSMPTVEALNTLVASIATEQWNRYLSYLEYSFKDLSKKAILSNITELPRSRGLHVRFSDAQSIQKLEDTILCVSHMLDLNADVMDRIIGSGVFDYLGTVNPASHLKQPSTTSQLVSLAAQTRIRKSRAESLLRRLDGTSSLVRNPRIYCNTQEGDKRANSKQVRSILDAQALETLQASSSTTAELATLARADAKKATQDARTLNTITILGFVYLPASFVATLLGTQYINVQRDEDGGGISITFAREMLIFLVLTVALLLVTVGGWLLWERRHRQAEKALEKTCSKA